jgi:hypothetical protein
MDTTKLTSLERAVYGQNLINQLTVENVKKLVPQLETYLNKKIELSSGGKSKNFVITLHEFENKERGQHLRSFVSFYLWYSKENIPYLICKNRDGGSSMQKLMYPEITTNYIKDLLTNDKD